MFVPKAIYFSHLSSMYPPRIPSWPPVAPPGGAVLAASCSQSLPPQSLREAFERVVTKRVMIDFPFGVLLSGGLHS